LLLGLKGTMSEAELHLLRQRLVLQRKIGLLRKIGYYYETLPLRRCERC
jgi:hypothetical protein